MTSTTGKKVTKIQLTAKCSDLCFVRLHGEDGEVIAEGDGYVPDFMPGEHYGDYVELDIDPDTGIITNWDKHYPQDMMIKDVEDM